MNKLRNSFIFLFLSWLMAGCTLMMEDYSIPEEERGVGEVYTEEIDGVGTISYQYNEGVTPVTSTAQDFIAQVEKDSVIYFYDHIPQKLLPKVGGYVAAGCSRTLPYGLNHLVKSVEHVTGLYKVVLQKATMDDIYAELDFDLDFDYIVPNIDSTALGEDSIYTDWSIVDRMNGVSSYTRADDNDEFDKDETKNTEFTLEYFSNMDVALNKLSLASLLIKPILDPIVLNVKKRLPEKMQDRFYFMFKYNRKVEQRFQHKFSKKSKYERFLTTTYTTEEFSFEAGVQYDGHVKSWLPTGNDEQILQSIKAYSLALRMVPKEQRKEMIAEEKYMLGKLRTQVSPKDTPPAKLEELRKLQAIRIPVGSLALAFVVKPHIDFSFDLKGSIAVYSQKKQKTVSGYLIENGKQTPLDEDPVLLSNTRTVVGKGSLNLSAQLGVGVGVELFSSVSTLINIYASGNMDVNVPITFYGDQQFATRDCYFKIYPKINADLRFNVNLFNIDVFSENIPLFEMELMPENKTKFPVYPELKLTPTPASFTMNGDEIIMKYKYFSGPTGIASTFADFYPKLAIYKYDKGLMSENDRYDEENLVAEISPTMPGNDYLTSDEIIEEGNSYSFTYILNKKDYDPEKKYAAVPVLYNETTGQNTYFSNVASEFINPTPSISVTSMYQTAGMPYSDEFNFGDPEDFYALGGGVGSAEGRDDLAQYEFKVILDVNNPAMMKEWGVLLNVNYKSIKLINKELKINRKKSGQYTLNFSFLCNVKTDLLELSTNITPYFIDEDGGINYGDKEEITMRYPVEHMDDSSKGEEIDFNL